MGVPYYQGMGCTSTTGCMGICKIEDASSIMGFVGMFCEIIPICYRGPKVLESDPFDCRRMVLLEAKLANPVSSINWDTFVAKEVGLIAILALA